MAIKRGKKWQAVVNYKADDGSYQKWRKSGFATKREALLAESEFKLNRTETLSENLLLSDWFRVWMETFKKPNTSPETYRKYTAWHKLLLEYFPNIRLSKLKRTQYQQILNTMAGNYKQSYLSMFNSAVRASVDAAVYDNLTKKNFTTGVSVGGGVSVKKSYLSEKNFLKLTDYTKAHSETDGSMLFFYLLCITGARQSEIYALTIDDISPGIIDINKSWKRLRKENGPTKNPQSVRKTPVPAETYSVVRSFYEHCYFDNPNHLLLYDPSRLYLDSSYAGEVLRQLLRKLDIPDKGITIHSLRHSHASVLFAHGISALAISKRLGHKDVLVTQKVYIDLIDELRESEDEKILSIF